MNYVTYTLSSYQILLFPKVTNGYLFVDPAEGLNFTYANSICGDTFFTSTFPNTANGGKFFPWGYPLFNTVLSADLGIFKGPTTLTISPSSLDTTYYTILKILYDFESNNNIINIEKGIVENILDTNVAVLDNGSPAETNISYTFTPTSSLSTTYFSTITVLNGNLGQNVFNLKITILPETIFKFDDFHLINTTHLTKTYDAAAKSLEVMEVLENDNSYITNFLLLSTTSSTVASSSQVRYTPTPTPSITPTPTITPSQTLTPTPTPTFTPTELFGLGVEYVTYE